ncbi:MAG: dicarboxylate/amino acid:cation symporter [Candidatus Omnitrophica bacterium]|nr:dicarboxylate/amino acid:cation symporter [Candidatus Omnitrophota bacterium]
MNRGIGGLLKTFLKNYAFSLALIVSIIIGSCLGIAFKSRASFFKPFGDIFLNLLFTAVVPMVFFSLSSAVAVMPDARRLGKILGYMMLVFIGTGIIASCVMLVGVKAYPPAEGMTMALTPVDVKGTVSIPEQFVTALTVPEFGNLLVKKNMLALIFFSLLIGLAALAAREKGAAFRQFLVSGNDVMTRVLGFIMLYAPIGLGAYFAYLVGVFGPQLLGSYFRAVVIYYPVALLYFFIGFSAYAYLAGRRHGVVKFWANIIPPSLTAFATGSSFAAIPANLEAAERIGVPEDIREVVIPIGATVHMDGSCLSAMLKISLLFGLFNMNFSGIETFVSAIGVSLVSGIVMSGIPGGGFLGELMIVTLYGFPLEALPVISMVGTLVDPPATMVNAVGDNVASMMVARILNTPK